MVEMAAVKRKDPGFKTDLRGGAGGSGRIKISARRAPYRPSRGPGDETAPVPTKKPVSECADWVGA